MDTMIVKTQKEYDNAEKAYQKTLNTNYFDIDAGKGTDVVEEVDYLLYNHLYKNEGFGETQSSLSRFYFTPSQAQEIIDYFSANKPGDLYDIERGLNRLNLRPERELNIRNSLIEIRDATHPIVVSYPVSVYDKSVVEARDYAVIHAYDNAHIDAHNHTVVYAFNYASVDAYNTALVQANHHSYCACHDESKGIGHSKAYLKAHDNSKIILYGKSMAELWDESHATVFNNARVTAQDTTLIEAHDTSHIQAHDYAVVRADGNVTIIACDNAQIKGKGSVLALTQGEVTCRLSENAEELRNALSAPDLIEKNILTLMERPGIDHDPFKAVSMLLRAVPEDKRGQLNEELKKLGCVDKDATQKYFLSIQKKNDYFRSLRKEIEPSWER